MADRSAIAVQKMFDSDPEFRYMAQMLYGPNVTAADVWAETYDAVVSKSLPDSADVHSPAALKRQQAAKERMQARIGLASNVLGLAAGGAALGSAAANPVLRQRSKQVGEAAVKAPKEVGGPLMRRVAGKVVGTTKKGRLIRMGAAGAVALQAANTGGDVIANRVLSRSAKKDTVGKLDVKGLSAVGNQFAGGLKGTGGAFGRARKSKPQKMGWSTVQGPSGTISSYGPVAPKSRRRPPKPKAAPAVPPPAAPAAAAPAPAPKPKPAPLERPAGVQGLSGKQKAGIAGIGAGGIYFYGQGQKKQGYESAYYGGKRDSSIEWSGTISKLDDEKRLAFGWASVTKRDGMPVVDKQDDWIHDSDLEDAAYRYVLSSRVGGDMHRRDGDSPFKAAELVESFVLTDEKIKQMGLPSDVPTGWWVGFKVHDDNSWQDLKSGRRTGFSIHGSGKRREIDYDDLMVGV